MTPSAVTDAAASLNLPWHAGAWTRLGRQLAAGRMPHALLLTGPTGTGKGLFARRLAMRLLCSEPDEDACGHCRSCTQFLAGTHPDYHPVTVPEGKSWIVVDQVRETLVEGLQLSAQYGARKLAVIDPADRMNRSSFNALLKTLEEPSGDAVLVLVSARPARLAATVRSRCQRVVLAGPDRETGINWLQSQGVADAGRLLDVAGGAPLAAMALRDSEFLDSRSALVRGALDVMAGRGDAGSVAAGWSQLPMVLGISWMQSLLGDLIRTAQVGSATRLVNQDLAQDLQSLAYRLDWQSLHRRLDALNEMRALAEAPLNPQLQWEAVMYSWEGDR